MLFVDHEREARTLGVDLWYPTNAESGPLSTYELLPGLSFEAAGALHEPPAAPGPFPLILFSHGRTGLRFAYSLLCEALAARGAVVVSSDHPGDALSDWLFGSFVDDRTNEINRVGDAHFLLGVMMHGHPSVPADVVACVDHERVVLAGHSYGAYTALATAAGARGVAPHETVAAVIGYQAYTRTMSDGILSRVSVPALFVVSALDRVTPPPSDADRPWALVRGKPSWRLDLARAGHQAASDMGLYAELARHAQGLPDVVRQYLTATAEDAAGPGRGCGRGVTC
jgi:predicted dienelactone hydrolase